MGNLILVLFAFTGIIFVIPPINAGETLLSSILTPTEETKTANKKLPRSSRSYYDPRFSAARPLYERLEYDRPSRCGRCLDDRYDDRDNYDRPRDRYDDDQRLSHRPTYGNRLDRNRNNDRGNDDDRRYNTDRRNGDKKNGTNDEEGDDKKQYDDKDDRRASESGGHRDRDRNYNRNRYDDRDRYRPDYYDRFLRDPYRERERIPQGYDDPYRERRPLYERHPGSYGGYDDGYAGRYDGYGGTAYRRPVYDDRFDRGNGYDDTAYGSYSPTAGRGPHDSFRPWDETYRGQAGWDAGGRGYYFASGRPDAGPAAAWSRPEYVRPEPTATGWQNVGYPGGYQDPVDYRGGAGYPQDPYLQDGYRHHAYRPSGWHSVGERRPYRDQSGVNQLDNRGGYGQTRPTQPGAYGQPASYGQPNPYGQSSSYSQTNPYGQADKRGQSGTYGQSGVYGQTGNRGQSNYGQNTNEGTAGPHNQASSTTPGTSYLYQREDEQVTAKESTDETTKSPS